MRTTNNLFRTVHNCTYFKWWFTQFERKCNILEIFHYFQYFERFRSMKKWQISKPQIVDWYLDFSNESYTTLKSVISSFKICLQNYGQLKVIPFFCTAHPLLRITLPHPRWRRFFPLARKEQTRPAFTELKLLFAIIMPQIRRQLPGLLSKNKKMKEMCVIPNSAVVFHFAAVELWNC